MAPLLSPLLVCVYVQSVSHRLKLVVAKVHQNISSVKEKLTHCTNVKHAWTNATKVENAVKRFKDARLFPLDKSAILKTDKLETSELFNSGPASVVEKNKKGRN